MTLRNTSGKFSLSNFGRKVSGVGEPTSPTRTNGHSGGYGDDDVAASPGRDGHGGGVAFDGLGRKLKGSLAHQSLLPALGNKDVRALQDIIASEKGVLQMAEKLAIENQKAASCLSPYGIQEGPDMQDILTQSSTLLGQLTTALNVFASHQANMRTCLKRIRDREEQLAQLRSRRRNTGQKADTAERKLAKMGPENKALPQQTELLERLRGEMRSLDQDIMTEETKIGDFKRQIVKEALSLKFGGLEELGEKMCIIGELGKLLLEEIPLEETPVGYGRAPYTGYEKTENAVSEATRCLSTVQFHAASNNPKPPGLPQPPFAAALQAPSLPSSIAAAEEFANYPGNVASPEAEGKGRGDYTLDHSDPYGGIHNPYNSGPPQLPAHRYSDFGGTRGEPGEVMFSGPSDDHHPPTAAAADMARTESPRITDPAAEHDYEYEQQKQMDAEEAWKKLDAEEAAWKEEAEKEEQQEGQLDDLPHPHQQENGHLKSPWEPLNVKRGGTPEPTTLHDNPVPPAVAAGPSVLSTLGAVVSDPVPSSAPASPTPDTEAVASSMNHTAPTFPTRPTYTPGPSEFYTPMENPGDREILGGGPVAPTGGKISAAAFRKGTKPRGSLEPDSNSDSENSSRAIRRLPVPPVGMHAAGIALPDSPAIGIGNGNDESPYEESFGQDRQGSPPPVYHAEESLR
ncbi:hypothetical protein CI109_103751 [Kwoniella shandongensis]|uniref:Uncharacterized protein n=1 Tax=Kwoniella shandongensis TaxID=1734106 RepID=A0A5M6C7X5_9TREE|nr:uncharacterized protein CI109_000553 [Kwoniella shandongensis]KAA5530981.1 hypothetical protein CI109_000553 [Kwoniella shandongensis]